MQIKDLSIAIIKRAELFLAHIFIKSEQCNTATPCTMLVHSVLFCRSLFPFTERVNFS